jgi:hypothetical protein
MEDSCSAKTSSYVKVYSQRDFDEMRSSYLDRLESGGLK